MRNNSTFALASGSVLKKNKTGLFYLTYSIDLVVINTNVPFFLFPEEFFQKYFF